MIQCCMASEVLGNNELTLSLPAVSFKRNILKQKAEKIAFFSKTSSGSDSERSKRRVMLGSFDLYSVTFAYMCTSNLLLFVSTYSLLVFGPGDSELQE